MDLLRPLLLCFVVLVSKPIYAFCNDLFSSGLSPCPVHTVIETPTNPNLSKSGATLVFKWVDHNSNSDLYGAASARSFASSSNISFTLQLIINDVTQSQTYQANTTQYTMAGVAGKTHRFRVKACDGGNNCSGYSEISNAIMLAPATPSNPPSLNLSGANTVIDLTSVSGATSYKIEQHNQANSEKVYKTTSSTSGNVMSHAAGKSYAYHYAACNAGGCSEYSPAAQIVTYPATPISPPSVSASGANTIINFASVSSATNYKVEQHNQTDNTRVYKTSSSTSGNTMSHIAGKSYAYRYAACNAGGCSGYSPSKSIVTKKVVFVHTDLLGSPVAESQ
ncbi:hypothetical protein [Pseudoalteromonas luteoviolacea]|uniref:Fibronectin type-III domain-containing protein n=1 Tax=Pseudoalteromonas luteoviolacea NCIMB 1942 TaxID=1365253 RepID=A0A167GC88_9GAMM|nr:hypothetical protein [Pseudoalteromonas luteoviolacea]KZN54877.1 hypothetical protein N482_24400 [Pseudoalteromonas luteoviolacea NCIMB 1942]